MDGLSLSTEFLRAGKDYLAALKKLGLDPEGLFWAMDRTINEYVLVLITGQYDHAGPAELSRLLFRAYNAAATPKEISPFILRFHSLNQAIVAEIKKALGIKVTNILPVGANIEIKHDVWDISFRPDWVYQLRETRLSPVVRSRQFRQFKMKVDALAA